MAFKSKAQKGEGRPDPTDPTVDRQRASTGNDYPSQFWVNPLNAGLDHQYGDEDGRANETRTLRSPTSTPMALGAIPIHEDTSYDSNWEYGTRGKPYDPPGPKSKPRWTPRGGGGKATL
jgi:hypothetical protein